LQYSELHKMVNDAITREEQIKRWSWKKKEALISGNYSELSKLSSSTCE
jgi:predicted GIY-YIG superfamily endonuclease